MPMASVESSKKIILFRHGETDWNALMRMQGSTDIPLNGKGFEQAELLRQHLANYQFDAIFASDLIRSQQTARVALAGHKLNLNIDDRVREANLGLVEGLTRDEVIERFGDDVWAKWRSPNRSDWDHSFPEAESKNQVLKRMKHFFDELHSLPHERIAICSHGGAIRVFLSALVGPEHLPDLIPNCAAFSFNYHRDGVISELSHLNSESLNQGTLV